MKKFTAIHLSDLHLDVKAEHDQRIVLAALFKDIESLVNSGIKIDAVFFTGDLIAKGKYYPNTAEYVKTRFISPLLSAANITSDRLFITPGNHDIELAQADLLLDSIYSNFKRHTEVNSLIDTIETRAHYWQHLSSFNKNLKEFEGAVPKLQNDLFRSFEVSMDGFKVGIACINSAWRSSGKANDFDYGELLVGERQVEKLKVSIADSDLAIALIHHPLDWLTTYEKPVVQRAIYKNFDALLHGHNHTADALSLVTSVNSAFISNAGCLYQSRDYFNGYSILEVSMESAQNVWTVSVREYYESREIFDASLRFAPGGKAVYPIGKTSMPTALIPSTAYIENVHENLNSKLLSYSASEIAPKTLHGIFVEPPLSHLSEKHFHSEKNGDATVKYLSLHELAQSEKAIFFMGGRESGKTTLLSYLCLKANDPIYLKKATHAIYIDIATLNKKTRASILESATVFCGGEYKRSEIIHILNEGRAIVCFDNLPLDESDTLTLLASFLKEFNKCKFCFAAEESIEQMLQERFIPIIGIDSDVVYIHSFSRKQTRELVVKWFPEAPLLVQSKVDGILDSIKKLGVPQTPFLISILLWIKERNINFTPINHSSIIDVFIDGLLEKLTESKDRSNTDSTIKRHFLAELAYAVYKSKKDRWTQNELEKFTIEYFEQKALSSSTKPFLEELFRKGVLLDLGEEVCFKFDCFRSFFLAQKMGDSEDLLNYALSREGFINLSTEIDYYTGLHRNKVIFLKKAIEIVESYRDSIEFNLDPTLFEKIGVENSILSPDAKEIIQKNLFGTRPTVQEQEEIFDDIELSAPRFSASSDGRTPDMSDDHENLHNRAPLIDYFETLRLASIILRNSELVSDAELKHQIYGKLLGKWAEVLLSIILTVDKDDELRERQLSEMFPGTDKMATKYLAKVMLPNIIFIMLKESLGTNKLEVVVKNHIESSSIQIERLLSTFLYTDLSLPNYLEELKKLLNNSSNNRYAIELIFFKLLDLFMFKNISSVDIKKVEELVGQVFVLLNDHGSKQANDIMKSGFITSLQKKDFNKRIVDANKNKD